MLTLLPFTYPEKTEEDIEREARLVEQWVGLAEERNAVLVPAPGSGIPGAPADWYKQKSTPHTFQDFSRSPVSLSLNPCRTPPAGMEAHIPVLFLDLNGKLLLSPVSPSSRFS